MDPRLVVVTDDPVNAETPLSLQRGVITPNELFFMRNRFRIPQLDPQSWQLTVQGEVQQEIDFSYTELLAMPSRTLVVTLECAGNGRSAMNPPAEGEPWSYGAVSTAEWTGVPLRQILEIAGLQDTATEIVAEGTDRGSVAEDGEVIPFARSLPLDKALHSDTLLAYAMNGETLPVDHGYPVRLIVPGWYGMASVKWLRRIRAISKSFHGFFQVDRYVMVGGAQSAPRQLREMGMRSLILSPIEGQEVRTGGYVVRGMAWSGATPVSSVDVSTDGGETWGPATWTSAEQPYAWRAWEYLWHAWTVGPAIVASRARDANGAEQPDDGEWNSLGYANNAVQRVHVTVQDDSEAV